MIFNDAKSVMLNEINHVGNIIYFDESIAISLVPNMIQHDIYIKVFTYSRDDNNDGLYIPENANLSRVSLLSARYINCEDEYKMTKMQLKHFNAIIHLLWYQIINSMNNLHLYEVKEDLDYAGISWNTLPYTLPIPNYLEME